MVMASESVLGISLSMANHVCNAENKENNPNSYNNACDGSYPAICGPNTTNDFLSCNDGNFELQTYKKDKFTGLHIQSFNNSITSCDSILNVSLCYKWSTPGGSLLTNCLIAVDADGNASYSTVTTNCPAIVNATCPEASPPVALICTDVTQLENWTCNRFFGSSGLRAVARTEVSTSNNGPPQLLQTDALFFKVAFNIKPSLLRVDINSTDPTTNNTNQNITIYLRNVTDQDNDIVQNITSWLRNGKSPLVLYLPFETNSSGNASIRDYSGLGNNGTQINNTVWQNSGYNIRGGSYKFDGGRDYIKVAKHPSFAFTHRDNFTIAVWANITYNSEATTSEYILTKNNLTNATVATQMEPTSYELYFIGLDSENRHSAGFLWWSDTPQISQDEAAANAECPALENDVAVNRTQFVVARWETINESTGNLSMWVNGRNCNSVLSNLFVSNRTMPLIIGDTPIYDDSGMNGSLDEVMIFNISLSNEEILYLNNSNGSWETMVSQELSAGQNWSACVTPNDGVTDGATICSQNLTILP